MEAVVKKVWEILEPIGFEIDQCTKSKYSFIRRDTITIKIEKPLFEAFGLDRIERKVLRQARIDIPSYPFFDDTVYEVYSCTVWVKNLKRKVDICMYAYPFESASFDDIDTFRRAMIDYISEVEKAKEELRREAPNIIEARYKIYVEMYKQYKFNMETLKSYVDEYFSQSPDLEAVRDLYIEVKEITPDNYAMPSKYKPVYDEESNTLILFDGHIQGKAHVNSEYEIKDNGIVVVYVSTYSAKSRYGNHHAQAYFFSPFHKKFFRRNAKIIRALGDIDDWKFSWFWTPESDLPDIYKRCFVCGAQLHYPAIPTKVMGHWVFLIKPCCACFKKINDGEIDINKAIEDFINKNKEELNEMEVF